MLKKSARVGQAIKILEQGEDLTNDQLSFDLNLSPQMVSHMKNDRRVMQQDIAKDSIATYDNPEFILIIMHEFSDGYTSPLFNGECIDENRLAFLMRFKNELQEALDAAHEFPWEKPPIALTQEEYNLMTKFVKELLDVRGMIDNFLPRLQREYKFSIKKLMKQMKQSWKARKWMKLSYEH